MRWTSLAISLFIFVSVLNVAAAQGSNAIADERTNELYGMKLVFPGAGGNDGNVG
jgi:hypothetical protein